ncbi:MAG: RIP metalloprotease RseP [Gemmatimonadetes bacterium]|nr:RIP metalloprotease RseP [Gemmatimonadota bacterium]
MGGAGLTILSTIIVIGLLVFVHELGHFVAAKWAGIYVHRFSLGLGTPIKALSFTRGETEYSVSWIPLGGYVKMASRLGEGAGEGLEGGTVEAEVPPDRVFEAKPVWVRMVVILAGVVMNALFAWVVFAGIVYFNGLPVIPTTIVAEVDRSRLPAGAAGFGELTLGDRIEAVNGASVEHWQAIERAIVSVPGDTVVIGIAGRSPVQLVAPQGSPDRRGAFRALRPLLAPIVMEVVPDRPAASAGLAQGDTILALDAEPVRRWEDLVGSIERSAGREIVLEVGRGGGRTSIRVTPAPEQDTADGVVRTIGRIGVRGPDIPDVREAIGLVPAVVEGGRRVAFVGGQVVGLVRGMFSGAVSTRELGGPIAIGMAAGQSARRGPEDFFALMALLSVNLAILNLLPIPILDGGQFLFLLVEGVTRRPVTGRIREWLTMAGFVAIVMLMVLAFSNDIRRVLENLGILG